MTRVIAAQNVDSAELVKIAALGIDEGTTLFGDDAAPGSEEALPLDGPAYEEASSASDIGFI